MFTRSWHDVLRFQHERPERYASHEVILFNGEEYDEGFPPRPIDEFISWLNGWIEKIPAEFRDQSSIEIDSNGGYEGSHFANVKISYRRPETDDEIGKRQAEWDAAVCAKENHERAEFERLKRQFSPTG